MCKQNKQLFNNIVHITLQTGQCNCTDGRVKSLFAIMYRIFQRAGAWKLNLNQIAAANL